MRACVGRVSAMGRSACERVHVGKGRWTGGETERDQYMVTGSELCEPRVGTIGTIGTLRCAGMERNVGSSCTSSSDACFTTLGALRSAIDTDSAMPCELNVSKLSPYSLSKFALSCGAHNRIPKQGAAVHPSAVGRRSGRGARLREKSGAGAGGLVPRPAFARKTGLSWRRLRASRVRSCSRGHAMHRRAAAEDRQSYADHRRSGVGCPAAPWRFVREQGG